MAQSITDQTSESVAASSGASRSESSQPHPISLSSESKSRARGGPAEKKRDVGRSEWRYGHFGWIFLVDCVGLTAKAKRNQTSENAITISKQQSGRGSIGGTSRYQSMPLSSRRMISLLRREDRRRKSQSS
jgi:hypothetical protein